ncbi:MAG: hydroxymethylglutaryl-CoA synthase [Micropruina sp.]|uniref:hydroxymethylglutaryl-CoA synthase n=1 Tax=Micropruina sp. TaxID=2737536 RepID=UPI0039E6A4A1
MTSVGIHDLSIATAHHVVDLTELAEASGVPPQKYLTGLGQEAMSFPAPDEDIVTMGAAAALPILQRHGSERVRTLLFATESGIDQSKSAGVFVHRLLGLPSTVRTVELKQACYSATAALQLAAGIVARDPGEQVLVIASDIARYQLDTPGEPTQGAAAAAMLIGADPALLALEPVTGIHTADVDDFWRPNDSTTAMVDGALSLRAYLASLLGAWDDFHERGGAGFHTIGRFVYHQPFTKMAQKAHARLSQRTSHATSPNALKGSLDYNRRLGNSYTASLYVGLAGALDSSDDLAGRRVGLFSYGSGSVGEFFTGIVQPDYAQHRRRDATLAALTARVPLGIDGYRALHAAHTGSSQDHQTPRVTTAPFRFSGVQGRARQYEANE